MEMSDDLSRRGFLKSFARFREREQPPEQSEEERGEAHALRQLRALGVPAFPLSEGQQALQVRCNQADEAFGDEELALLAPLAPKIAWLDLSKTDVTDAGMDNLAEMEALRRLYLKHTAVGDDGLAALAGLGALAYLNLFGAQVTDEGLRHLGALESLETVYLWQTGVTEAGAEELRARRPELEVVFGGDFF